MKMEGPARSLKPETYPQRKRNLIPEALVSG
jgi:hypothetical protein